MKSVYMGASCLAVILINVCVEGSKDDFLIKIGALFETEAPDARRALRLAVDDVNRQWEYIQARLKYVTRNITSGDTLDAFGQTCDLAQIGVMSLVSVTSCSVDMTLRSLAANLRLPMLQIRDPRCAPPSSDYIYSSQPTPNLILRALVQYLQKNTIRNAVLVYEDIIDTSIIQDLTYELAEYNDGQLFPTNFLVRIGTLDGNASSTSIIRAANHIQTLFVRSNPIQVDAIIVFARPNLATSILAKIYEDYPLQSASMRWIVVNNYIRSNELEYMTRTTALKITVIKQYHDRGNTVVDKFVRYWNEDVQRQCPACKSVGANDIPLVAFYVFDGIQHLSNAFSHLLSERKIASALSLSCDSKPRKPWYGGKRTIDALMNLNSSGLLSRIDLTEDGNNKFANFEVLTKPEGLNKRFKREEIWFSNNQSVVSGGEKQLVDIQNTTFRIVTLAEPPFVMIYHRPDGTVQYHGFAIDLLEIVAKKLGFRYEFYEVGDGKYGAKFLNGSWNGLIGDVISGKAELAVAAMTITADREVVVDFAKRYMDYSVGIVIKRPQLTSSLFSFIEPFHNSVWFCILSSLILVVIFIYIINQVSPNRSKPWEKSSNSDSEFGLATVFWFAYSCLMQQGSELHKVTFAARIAIGFWWLFALIVTSSYTANLAAFLTVKRMDAPVRSFGDLANQEDIKYGTVSDTSIFDFIMKTGAEASDPESVYKKMSRMINSTATRIRKPTDGFTRVASDEGNFAFLWDVAVIEYEVLKHSTCGITTVGDSIFDKGYGFALPQGSPYRDKISHEILDLQDKGEIDRLRAKWWPKSGKCDLNKNPTSRTGTELTLKNFTGIFFVLAAGLLLAFAIAVMEIIVHLRKGKDYPPNLKEHVRKESDQTKQSREIHVVLSKKELLRQLMDEILTEDTHSVASKLHTEGSCGNISPSTEKTDDEMLLGCWTKANESDLTSTTRRRSKSNFKRSKSENGRSNRQLDKKLCHSSHVTLYDGNMISSDQTRTVTGSLEKNETALPYEQLSSSPKRRSEALMSSGGIGPSPISTSKRIIDASFRGGDDVGLSSFLENRLDDILSRDEDGREAVGHPHETMTLNRGEFLGKSNFAQRNGLITATATMPRQIHKYGGPSTDYFPADSYSSIFKKSAV